ncbi:MAG: 16S rRNA (adenine(1518)-N(6)/adenine(1519)-N(6))-dimethyltransferase RsmA [Minisyncoccota bacterium]
MRYVSPKKSLGQHFLRGEKIAVSIAEYATANTSSDTILEIGPGRGVLTRALLGRAKKVIAIEKDARLIPLLRETFSNEITSGQLSLQEGDVLTLHLSSVGLSPGSYILAANIPYYITGAILRTIVGGDTPPTRAILLVQHEVAERIARSKKESLVSLAVKAYGTPRYVKKIPASFFSPTPKVDSAILLIENISHNNFPDIKREKKFFEILHAAFAHKRKQVGKGLETVLGERCAAALASCAISPHARAEDISLEKFLCLSSYVPTTNLSHDTK